jgi:hypothetical protein
MIVDAVRVNDEIVHLSNLTLEEAIEALHALEKTVVRLQQAAPPETEKMTFSKGKKRDIQLHKGLIEERRLAEIFAEGDIQTIELKTEKWIWEKTLNLALEFWCRGHPSGIATSTAGYWVHALRRNGKVFCYLMFPREVLLELAREQYRRGNWRCGGDGGQSKMVLLPLREIFLTRRRAPQA